LVEFGKDTFEKHPVEAGEVKEVGEGEGGAGDDSVHAVSQGQCQDPVEGGEAECTEEAHVDLVPEAAHLSGEVG
jgi:hypothetical protein